MPAEPAECPSENELLAWVAGRLAEERVVALDLHVDTCTTCSALLGEALRSSRDGLGSRGSGERAFRRGDVVADRYEVVRFLARGGMGEVYEVFDRWLKEAVALKTLIAPIADDVSALARLKSEVLLARKVSHPNICRIFDLGFHPAGNTNEPRERIAFLTMELLRGETLGARVRRVGRLSEEQARAIALQIVAGMVKAHDSGIVHRDLKSDNVMLVEEPEAATPRAVILDFGLARSSLVDMSQPLTSNSQALGTLDYMAPEQLAGRGVTAQSDIYSFGMILFEMLVGRLPFEGEPVVARALKRARTDVRLPHIPDLALRFRTVVERCLAHSPRARFRRASEIVGLLEADAPPAAVARRSSWVAIATAVVVAGGLLVTGLALKLGDSPVESERERPVVPAAPQPVARSPETVTDRSFPSAPVPTATESPIPRTPRGSQSKARAATRRPASSSKSAAQVAPQIPATTAPTSGPSARPAGDGLVDPFRRP